MALSASNTTKTLAEEAQIRGQSTAGTSQQQAAASAERIAQQVDQGQVPASRQGNRSAQGRGRRRRALTKKRGGRRRARATRRR